MGWENRDPNGGPYYYGKSRTPDGRVVSTYFGDGPLAHLVANMDEIARDYRAYREASLEAFSEDVDAADAAVRACTASVKARLAEALEAEGYRYHRGEWRRPRREAEPGPPATPADQAMPAAPEAPSEAVAEATGSR